MLKNNLFQLLMLTSLFVCGGLDAKLEDHLRKVEGKSQVSKMKNIDFIYMINLDQRPEKYQRTAALLSPYGIHPYRFSAVNGWELSLAAINDLGVNYKPGMQTGIWGSSYLPENNFEVTHEVMHKHGQTYFCHCMARGTIGISLSHLSILQDAYNSGYETIWVLEDDIEIVRDPRLISEMIEKLDKKVGKNGWDLFFTDQDTQDATGKYIPCKGYAKRPNFEPKNPERFQKAEQIDNNFRKIGARYGAYSMIVRRSGMAKILNFIKKYGIFLPYDMEFYLPEDIRMYTVVQDIVIPQPKALSDNGGPNYLNK